MTPITSSSRSWTVLPLVILLFSSSAAEAQHSHRIEEVEPEQPVVIGLRRDDSNSKLGDWSWLVPPDTIGRLISDISVTYRRSQTDEEFRRACEKLRVDIGRLQSLQEQLAAFSYLLGFSSNLEPGSRYILLSTIGNQDISATRQEFQRMIYAELWRLVLLEREQFGYPLPSQEDTLRVNPKDALPSGEVDSIDRLREIKEALSEFEHSFDVVQFPSLAMAIWDSCSTEQQRFDVYLATIYLGSRAPEAGSISRFFLDKEDGYFHVVAKRHFRGEAVVPPLLRDDPNPVAKEYDVHDIQRDRNTFDDIIQEIETLKKRTKDLEHRVDTLEVAVRVLKKRVTAVEERVNELETRVEEVYQELKADIAELRQDAINWILKGKIDEDDRPTVNGQPDRDIDGIEDPLERKLLKDFAPVIHYAAVKDMPRAKAHGIPASLEWYLARVQFNEGGGDARVENPVRGLEIIRNHRKAGQPSANWKLEWHDRAKIWGDGQEHGHNIGGNRGIYGRVWRPWPNTNYYSVQYYVFMTFNETAITGDVGNHDGDWICLDFGVVPDEADRRGYKIVHAIYHNHGRQLFIHGKALKQCIDDQGHPHAWLERQANEPWPNKGTRGIEGWPRVDGFATNIFFDHEPTKQWKGIPVEAMTNWFRTGGQRQTSEFKAVRQHGIDELRIEWRQWRTQDVPNLGERACQSSGTVVDMSLDGTRGQFIAEYAGTWGSHEVHTDVPKGPPFNLKMWDREFDGPWNRNSPGYDTPAVTVERDETPRWKRVKCGSWTLYVTPGFSF